MRQQGERGDRQVGIATRAACLMAVRHKGVCELRDNMEEFAELFRSWRDLKCLPAPPSAPVPPVEPRAPRRRRLTLRVSSRSLSELCLAAVGPTEQ